MYPSLSEGSSPNQTEQPLRHTGNIAGQQQVFLQRCATIQRWGLGGWLHCRCFAWIWVADSYSTLARHLPQEYRSTQPLACPHQQLLQVQPVGSSSIEHHWTLPQSTLEWQPGFQPLAVFVAQKGESQQTVAWSVVQPPTSSTTVSANRTS